ncbi:MAG: GNAT family N-acetyltransferase [Candidatus Eremiobacteraeota bacterium]|nr:GNAT family N-acetyltransferase [Candidatus Eremiobacteraeota bacterium]
MDEAAMLALNNANAPNVWAIDASELRFLLGEAFHVALRAGGRDAFLIALDQTSSDPSPNFHWFKARYPRFVYIDRVVVAPHRRNHGVGRELYEEVFAAALEAGHTLVTCEVNFDPPNPISDRFHAKLGFEEVGRATVLGGAKTVRYLVKRV